MMKSRFNSLSTIICVALVLAAAFTLPRAALAQESGLELFEIAAPVDGDQAASATEGDAEPASTPAPDARQTIWLAYGPKSGAAYTFWYGTQDGITADWSLPEGYALGETRPPVLGNIAEPEAPVFVFDGGARIAQEITLPEGVTSGAGFVSLSLAYMVCDPSCEPAEGTATLGLAGASPQTLEASYILPRPRLRSDFWIRADEGRVTIAFNTNLHLGGRVAAAYFLPLVPGFAEAPAPLSLEPFKETGFASEFAQRSPLEGVPAFDGVLIYYDAGVADFAQWRVRPFNDIAMASGEIALPPPPVRSPKAVPEAEAEPEPEPEPESQPSYLMIISLALLGGLILNVMPCVLPVLALKVFSAIKSGTAEESALRKDALAYTAGIMVTFAGLAGVLIAIRAAGIGAGWGYQLQSPVFVLIMALIFFTMGLNFAGVFELPGFLSGAGQRLTEKQGSTGSFFTGVLTTLVAAPCTAPFMVTAVAFALAKPPAVAISVFLALGLGLAIPYLLIGFVPASRRLFPKPGKWMQTFRTFLAFPMFGAVVWMVWVLSIQAGSEGVLLALSPMVLLAFGIWALQVMRGPGRVLTAGLAAVAIVLAVSTVKPAHNNAGMGDGDLLYTLGDMPVRLFTPERLVRLQADGKNVFIHHWAAWCIICIMHENMVFSDAAFQQYLAENDIVFLQVDRTLDDPVLLEYMEAHYGRSSQPIDVFYSSDPTRPPVIMPQLFTTARVTAVMAAELAQSGAKALGN